MKREHASDEATQAGGDASPRVSAATASSASLPLLLETDLNAHPQRVVDKGTSEAVVVNSPYGEHRARYGWGNLFAPARRAVVPGYSNIHIGVSSLNAVPGKSNRVMKTLLQQYRRKFSCLEHCYPYHKVADQDTWRCWAEMVCDSNTPAACAAGDGDGDGRPSSHPRRGGKDAVHCVDRFIFTVKANNLLTHVKHLALDAELEAHIDMFFRDRCPALGPFLGPILVQLPPYFHCTPAHLERLVAFNARLPRREVDVLVQDMTLAEEEAAAATGGDGGGGVRVVRHDSRARVRVVRRRLIRIAVEFRHRSWYDEAVFAVLRQLGWSLVVAHHAADATFATHVDTGTSFLYARLHGAVDENVGDYGPVRMNAWAAMVRRFLAQPTSNGDVREVYMFLNNNTSHVQETTSSVVDATYLAERLAATLPPPPPSSHTASETDVVVVAPPATTRTTTTMTATSTSPMRTQPHAVTTRRSRSRSTSNSSNNNKRNRSRTASPSKRSGSRSRSASSNNNNKRSRSRSTSSNNNNKRSRSRSTSNDNRNNSSKKRSRSRSRSTSSTRRRGGRAAASGTTRSRAVKIE